MRKFSKMLAFALAAAMVFTAFAPAAKADAAEKGMEINKQGKILYVTDGTGINDAAQVGGGKGNVSEYDFAVSNKPDNWKDNYTFTWSSSDEKIITVGKAGLTKAVSVGTADVECLVSDKATGAPLFTLTNTITVKANADSVKIIKVNGEAAEDVEGLTAEAGTVIDLDRAMYDAAGKETTKRGTLVTDYTRWCVTDAEDKDASDVITVNQKNGKFTFTDKVAAGKYYLFCETYQSNKYPEMTAESDKIEVVVDDAKPAIEKLEQIDAYNFKIYFDKAVKSLGNVVVERVYPNFELEFDVAKVDPAKDGMSATVTMFAKLEDKVTYNVKVDGFDTYPLLASLGKPETIKLFADVTKIDDIVELVTIKDDEPIAIDYKLYDANKVDVTTEAKGYVEFFIDENVDSYDVSTEETENGSGLLWLENAGTEYVVGVEFQPEDNEDNDPTKNLKATKSFVGQKAKPVTIDRLNKYTIAADGKLDTQVDNLPYVNAETVYPLNMDFILSTGGDPVKAADLASKGFTGDLDIREVTPNIAAIQDGGIKFFQINKEAKFAVYYVYETEDEKTVEQYLGMVKVKATDAVKFNGISLGTNANVTVGNVPGYDDVEITVKGVNNYGKDCNPEGTLEIKGLDENSANALKEAPGAIVVDNVNYKLTVYGAALYDGIESTKSSEKFSFEVKCGNFTAKLTVTVKKAAGKDAYKVVAEGFDKDVARTTKDMDNGSAGVKSATFKVFKTQGGVLVGEIDSMIAYKKDDVTVTNGAYYFTVTKNGVDITDKVAVIGNEYFGNEFTFDFSGIDNETDKNVTYDLGAGKYEFVLYEGYMRFGKPDKKEVARANGSVTCNPYSYSYEGKASDDVDVIYNDADLLAALKIKDINGNLVDVEKLEAYVSYDVKEVDAADYVYIESVVFQEALGDGTYAKYVVPVGVSLIKEDK